MARSPKEIQRLLAQYKQKPLPSYYSTVSRSTVSISPDFETYLILLDNTTKQALIERVRKSIDKADQSSDRDGMAKLAAKSEMAAASAIGSDLSLSVGDYTSFADKQIQGTNLAEVAQLVNSIGSALGPTLFQRDQADAELIAAGLELEDLERKSSAAERKRQLSSWVEILISYMTD
jgi:hypothetical protein